MSETTEKCELSSNKILATNSSHTLMPTTSTSATPLSPLATNSWYRQKFELYRDVIEEKVRDAYPELPQTYKLKPTNIECSTMKGYDLDFPIELHDGRSTIASVAYSSGSRPPYTKEERRQLVTIRRNMAPNY
ncbi:unnamed protein product [Rotaria magnacalcarata]|uniref:Uncharacterized protein n=2 Tax=Rotaria magnacalcarata TaxID=392030 RepID=A0A814UDU9_9BILA|nr:unnamed protein product [Rotaria magnacalcarata]CAF1585392.1 unnamed protein product [Rotaria magnacalcarata]CAF2159289.1 unnamed protein product [Rotaria magnacalcarata]CAF3782066.1 unnamed protein product [Rotaria magnacalcarata]CAF3801487.1 unnamed protein product [Rotaria magnacalcarata]